MPARALMVLGTASHVGKSVLTAALGRILTGEGLRVAPFKAQNMALNSAVTPDGREIGRAQAMQAEACRVEPRVEMNPILIKPSTDALAQIVVRGRVWRQVTAADYHMHRVEELFPIALDSYRGLAAEYDVIVIEGAGSPAEINLKEHDIVNMRMAEAADAACLLLGDIDRGGVFAALAGTLALLEPGERARIRGFAINKFRGDTRLLEPGLRMIEERTEKPCVGVIPYLKGLGLDEEDGVAVEDRRTVRRIWPRLEEGPERPLRVGVVALPHLANFTDFGSLAMEPSVALAYLERPEDASAADVLILPGTKQTLDDLIWLESSGFSRTIVERRQALPRSLLAGICGGMQMLGHRVDDPEGAESDGRPRSRLGLGLLPIATVLRGRKTTVRAVGKILAPRLFGRPVGETSFHGYEIHLGETVYAEGAVPFAELMREGSHAPVRDGAVSSDGFVLGTYVHGLFDQDAFRHIWIDAARAAAGLEPARERRFTATEREARLDRLAAAVRASLDIQKIKQWLALP